MSNATRLIDPARVALIYAGIPIADFADGEVITVTIPESYTRFVGADGETTRIKRNDNTCEIVFRLTQGSATNILLTNLFLADKNSPGGLTNPVLLKDLNGSKAGSVDTGTEIIAEQAWLVKLADIGFGTELSVREWMIHTGPALIKVGGN